MTISTIQKRPTTVRRMTALALTVVSAAAGLAVAMPASNASADTITGKGTVTATSLTQRTAPSTSAPVAGQPFKKGAALKLDCNLDGTSVAGNSVWFKIAGKHAWVSAHYVKTTTSSWPIACTAANVPVTRHAKTTAYVNLRQAPSTNDRIIGHIAKGGQAQIWCKVYSQKIDGDAVWYQESNGWVAGKYVSTGKTIPYCSQA